MKPRRPPWLATWLARWLSDPYRQEALLGDLTEEYRRGRSRVWYWKEVLAAVVVRACVGAARRKRAWTLVLWWWLLLAAASYEWKWPVIIFAADPGVYWLIYRRRQRFKRPESLS